MSPHRALFLDRDGTLIPNVPYPRDPALVEIMEGAPAALRLACSFGYKLVIISNQSGVARGLIEPSEARAVQDRVEELFGVEGVRFDAAYFCFHAPDAGCRCRKPAPGMVLDAALSHGIDCTRSLFIGDKDIDVAAGAAAGCSTILLGGAPRPGPTRWLATWADVAAFLSDVEGRRDHR